MTEGSPAEFVVIRYRRPPARDKVFRQRLIFEDRDLLITFMPATPMERPLRIDGRLVLEDGSPAVWFTLPGAWHDIGRFHLRDGTFTGIYANVITPVRFVDRLHWETTDLFLDVWLDIDGATHLLDEDELDEAIRRGWVSSDMATAARREAHRLLQGHRHGRWPPAYVHEWTLDRVRRLLVEP